MGWKAAKLVQPAAKPVATWMANQLLFKPLWRIQQGFANPIGTASSLHTAATWSDRVRLGMAVANLVEGSSSESYQQNGGPSAPVHQQGQPAPLVVPAASPSAHGGRRSGSKPRVIEPVKNRYEPDNPGLYWCPDGYHLRKHRGKWMCVRKG